MLKRALLYKDELMKKYVETWDDISTKYYYCDYHNELEIKDDDWNLDQFVSINEAGEVVGYITGRHNQIARSIESISLIAFTTDLKDRVILLTDLQKLIHDYFYVYNYNRVEFGVYVGNPVEKFYDKYINACGGKVCGYCRQSERCMDGTYVDHKTYEILACEYKENIKQGEYTNLKLMDKKVVTTF